jgi:hypothetical protein
MLPIRRWVASPLTSHDNRSSSALEKSFSIPTREGDFSSADGRPLLTITLCKEAYNLIEEKVEKRPVCYTFYTNTTIDEGRKKRFLDWEIFSSDRAILILNNVRARSVRRGWHTTSNREKKKTEWGTNKKRNPTIRGITCSLALFPLVMSMCLKYFFFFSNGGASARRKVQKFLLFVSEKAESGEGSI